MSDIFLIVAPPLVSFIINFFFGKTIGDKMASALSVIAVFVSFVLTVYFFFIILESPNHAISQTLYTWFEVNGIGAEIAFTFDRLSALFCLIITGIGSLIHIYSIEYMKQEKNSYRFFSFLSLFIFFMLILVLGDNLLLTFLGWEGVGLTSYLLIGYYGDKVTAGNAAQKAFVVNRIGDFGFLVAMFMGIYLFSTFSFAEINQNASELLQQNKIDPVALNIFLLAIFFACTGKSAQFPLYTWILDAMEAPTPVSALIHAATMVTAGLYLIARLNAVFILSPAVLSVILYVGIFTAFIAAFIAIAQNDIKRILAFSTVSQLGYMFIAMGVGAFEAGIFHLFTHAFFKALLFLGAGSVIYSLHHEQDIRKMGGLSSTLSKTSFCFAVATYSIAGLPFSAGFFSKDEILWYVYFSEYGSLFVWIMAVLTAGLTAYYMYRLFFKVFYNKPCAHKEGEIKEASLTMIIPLQIFALFAAFVGFLGIPKFLNPFSDSNLFHHYFKGFFAQVNISTGYSETQDWMLLGITFLAASCGTFIGWFLFNYKDFSSVKTKHILIRLAENRLYVDVIYDAIILKPLKWVGNTLFKRTGEFLILSVIKLIGESIEFVGDKNKTFQNGLLPVYLLSMCVGIVLIVFIII